LDRKKKKKKKKIPCLWLDTTDLNDLDMVSFILPLQSLLTSPSSHLKSHCNK
jgi:hypothetical protein